MNCRIWVPSDGLGLQERLAVADDHHRDSVFVGMQLVEGIAESDALRVESAASGASGAFCW